MSLLRASVRPRRRALSFAAFATASVLAAVAVTQAVAPAPAHAAAALSCDQNTIYATAGQGQFVAINVAANTVSDVIAGTANPFSPANNGLGVGRNGLDAYAFTNGTANNSNGNTLARYDSAAGAVSTVADANPSGAPASTLRGAVNPVTGIYYYATGGDPATISAYNPKTGDKIGVVGRIPGLQAGNGDFAFSTQGLLFVVASNAVYRLNDETIPTTAGTTSLAATKLTDLPTGTNSPGIAFSSDGYLYVSSGMQIIKLDSSSGAEVSRMTTPAISNITSYSDLASCNYANTLTGKADVKGRWKSGDQFALKVDGGNLSTPSTATTSGNATGVQAQKAGAALAIPARTYTVSQTAGNSTTRLADYSTTYRCANVNDDATVASGSGDTAQFSFPAATSADGTDVVCTFVNTVSAISAAASDDTGTTASGTPLTVGAPGVLADDAGTDLTVTSNTQPAHGQATVAADGSYVYTPAKGFSGTDTFQYTTTDGGGGTSTSTVTITVTPASSDDVATARAGQALVVDAASGVLANDSGTGLTAAVATGPSHGSLVLGRDGSFRYVPADGFSGTDTFTYTATDSEGASTTSTVTVTVLPTAVDDTASAVAGTPTTIAGSALTANDDGTGLTVTAVSTPGHGTASVTPAGDVLYTPADDFSGTDTVDYTVTDGTGGTDTGTVTVTVAPRASADTADAVAGSPLDVPAGRGLLGNDGGSGPLEAALATGPTNGTVVSNPDGSYVYTPAKGFSGTDTFTYTLTDANGVTSTGTVTVAVAPKAVDDTVTVVAGGTAHVDGPGVLGNDLGTGLSAVITTGPQHGTASIAPNGEFDYTPTPGFSGTDTVTYEVTDAAGRTATATVTITVEPVAVDDQATTPNGTTVTTTASAGLLANDLGTGLRVTDHGTPAHGTVTVDADGTWSYTPDAGTSGTDSFEYRVTDAAGQTATARAWVIVGDLAMADQGTATAGRDLTVPAKAGLLSNDRGTGLTAVLDGAPRHGDVTVAKDGSYVYTPAKGFSGTDDFTYTATDAEKQTSTGIVTIVVLPDAVDDTTSTKAGTTVTVAAPGVLGNDLGTDLRAEIVDAPAHGTATIAAGGTTSYTPVDGFSGTDQLTYRATDASGGSDVATVTIHVGPIVVDDSPAGGTTADQPLVVDADHGVLANDKGTGLTAAVTDQPKAGTVTMAPDGSYTYTPKPGTSGTDSFGYEVTDGNGQTGTGTVTIVVSPKATPDVATVAAGDRVTVAAPGVLGNDVGSGLTVTAVTPAAHGTATITPDGTVDYTPAPGFSGTDVVTYTVTDRDGGTATTTVTVSVTPRALDDRFSTPAGTALSVPAPGLLVNDLGSGLTVTGVGTPAHGTIDTRPNGSFVYTPVTGFSGTDRVTYTATDSSGTATKATATIVVGALAVDDTGSTRAGTPLTVDAAHGVLSNDSGSSLTATLDGAPTHGTVELARDGSYVYTAKSGFSGTDVFTYTATDGEGQTRTGTVTITVLPTAVDDAASTPADTTLTVDAPGVLGNDLGTGLRVTSTGPAAHGTVTIDPSGRLVYTPTAGYSGKDAVTYTVADRDGGTATATVTITVRVKAVADSGRTIAGKRLVSGRVGGVMRNDDGSALWVALASEPSHGTVALDLDGSYDYMPHAGFVGVDTFDYTATDEAGQTARATVDITVLGAAVAVDDEQRGTTDHAVTVDVTANDTPTEGATFDRGTVVIVDPATGDGVSTLAVPDQGTWTVVDGSVVFTPAKGFDSKASVQYRVTDTAGETVQAVVTVSFPMILSATQLAFTGSASVLGIAAMALLGVALGLALSRRGRRVVGPIRGRRRAE
ncbi:beta strand repeat-containing protein [Frigoribacterium sp. CFBP 8751]|uniref:beta strand repeat-containing protein n=1 Tax=Frigoribacterium sp. CFBP 8751 TaxID=2775277 RepID=UPI0017855311|nr:Ig-like domain-containing protein [Frigoribacterium sp. CFBP 8751]MBD8538233.1 tandem-95 repeat protein [Frigoribacterium sp. CFBP 8751]